MAAGSPIVQLVNVICTKGIYSLGCHDTNNAVTQQAFEELSQDHGIRDIRDLENTVHVLCTARPLDNVPETRQNIECTPHSPTLWQQDRSHHRPGTQAAPSLHASVCARRS